MTIKWSTKTLRRVSRSFPEGEGKSKNILEKSLQGHENTFMQNKTNSQINI